MIPDLFRWVQDFCFWKFPYVRPKWSDHVQSLVAFKKIYSGCFLHWFTGQCEKLVHDSRKIFTDSAWTRDFQFEIRMTDNQRKFFDVGLNVKSCVVDSCFRRCTWSMPLQWAGGVQLGSDSKRLQITPSIKSHLKIRGIAAWDALSQLAYLNQWTRLQMFVCGHLWKSGP